MEYEFEEWVFKSLDEITDKINDGTLFCEENQNIIKKVLSKLPN